MFHLFSFSLFDIVYQVKLAWNEVQRPSVSDIDFLCWK